jgi:hypothetical protein
MKNFWKYLKCFTASMIGAILMITTIVLGNIDFIWISGLCLFCLVSIDSIRCYIEWDNDDFHKQMEKLRNKQ